MFLYEIWFSGLRVNGRWYSCPWRDSRQAITQWGHPASDPHATLPCRVERTAWPGCCVVVLIDTASVCICCVCAHFWFGWWNEYHVVLGLMIYFVLALILTTAGIWWRPWTSWPSSIYTPLLRVHVTIFWRVRTRIRNLDAEETTSSSWLRLLKTQTSQITCFSNAC